jgi:hypothetical protein
MRYFIYAYLLIFILGLLFNSIMWIRAKANIFILLYEILTACYLTAATLIYITPGWPEYINIWFCALIIPFAAVDIYMTVWGPDELITPPGMNISQADLETARVMAVVFVSPAYICGILLLLETLIPMSDQS